MAVRFNGDEIDFHIDEIIRYLETHQVQRLDEVQVALNMDEVMFQNCKRLLIVSGMLTVDSEGYVQ